MPKQPVTYLRKSRVTNDRHLSWQVQEGKVRELAAAHGENGNLIVLSDWNRSGGKGTNGRPGYHQLVEMIEAGLVSAVYSYSLSRLSRSISDFATLAELCLAQKVPIRLAADQNLDFGSASGRFVINVLVAIAQMERELASERSKDTVAVRRARGDRIGHPFYGEKPGEDLAAVLQAYDDAGSVIGAGRLLNERGVPTRQGKPWSTTPVREILQRHNALPHRKRPGAKAAAPFILFHLLRCHCGRLMSASRFTTTGGTKTKRYVMVVYRCLAGRTTPGHGRLNVSESKLLPWVKAEATRLAMPVEQVEVTERDEARRLELEARRQRVLDNYEDGLTDKAGRDAKLLAIGDELTSLDATEQLLNVPPAVDWDWEPKAINAVLRAMWDHMQLGPDMLPAAAVWRVPEWRAGGPVGAANNPRA
jgi:DNA invertase Pin-like site-specific DNA recombinase